MHDGNGIDSESLNEVVEVIMPGVVPTEQIESNTLTVFLGGGSKFGVCDEPEFLDTANICRTDPAVS